MGGGGGGGGMHYGAPRLKTRLCRHFQTTGTCPFADRCGFAHSEAEIGTPQTAPAYRHTPRPPPFVYGMDAYYGMKPRGPAPELVKTRLCKHYANTGSCPFESRCLFAHGDREIRPRMNPIPLARHPAMVPVLTPWSPGPQWTSPYTASSFLPPGPPQ